LTPRYIGRFAPSPTGQLHLGSVYTALASFLAARACGGLWKLRFDDLDTPRNVKGADSAILHTLEVLGLHWDGQVDYQHLHISEYEEILADLIAQNKVYRCGCSRKNLSHVYAQTCRNASISPETPHSLRLIVEDDVICFYDELQGRIIQHVATHYGDFILKRKDSILAYQFAVVVDDARQQVTDVVRGQDLLDETPKQRYLQHCLNLPTLNYCHVPILVDKSGKKLSKTTLASAVDISSPNQVLFQLLAWLNQNPPLELANTPVADVLAWAITHWNTDKLKGVFAISI
jgi:glutamyl-Q tRNA(Asp) synthetase